MSKSLVDVTWGETVFVAVGDLSEVEIAMDCLGDGDWEYKVLIFHLKGVIGYKGMRKSRRYIGMSVAWYWIKWSVSIAIRRVKW